MIQQLEKAHLVPVAASSCDVMTLLWPVTPTGGLDFQAGLSHTVTGSFGEDRVLEASVLESLSCVVRVIRNSLKNECRRQGSIVPTGWYTGSVLIIALVDYLRLQLFTLKHSLRVSCQRLLLIC